MYMCVHIYIYMCIYIYIHIYTYTYKHTLRVALLQQRRAQPILYRTRCLFRPVGLRDQIPDPAHPLHLN